MRRTLLLFSASLLFLFPMVLQAGEAGSAGSTDKTIAEQFNTLSAKVIGIDQATHTLTLENSLGEHMRVQVDPNRVKNFDQIKVNDNVVVRETQRWAVSLQKREKGEKPGVGAAMTMETAPKGAKPGVEASKTIQISAEITHIDTANQTVKLKGPEGNTVELKVRDPKNLAGLKKGDMVAASYTQGLAISVEPAPKK